MRALLIPIALVALGHAARASDISSAYTDLDAKKDCVTYAQSGESDGDWADLACAGYRGYPVLIAYDDARESLFYGFPPGDMTPVWESFSGFNSAGPKVEWRIETNGDVAVPFAAIHRRSVSNAEDPDKPAEVLVVAKVGQDGHDRGQKVVASALADLGFEVDMGPLFQTPDEAAAQAIADDVHIVGVSSLAAGHLTLVPALKKALVEAGRGDIMVVVGGVIPPQDFAALREAGAEAIFPPGTVITEAAADLLETLNQRLGYAQRPPS